MITITVVNIIDKENPQRDRVIQKAYSEKQLDLMIDLEEILGMNVFEMIQEVRKDHET